MRNLLLSTFFLFSFIFSFAQSKNDKIVINIHHYQPIEESISENISKSFLNFDNVTYDQSLNFKPFYTYNAVWDKRYIPSLKNISFSTESLSDKELQAINKNQIEVEGSLEYRLNTYTSGKKEFLSIQIFPYVNEGGEIKKITRLEFQINKTLNPVQKSSSKSQSTFADNSVLSTGNWYKIAVTKTGVFRLNKSFLEGMGMNLNSVNPKNISIYGFTGGMMVKSNAYNHVDDLQELPIIVSGESDNTFNDQDFILFYGEGPNGWNFEDGEFEHEKNVYSDTTYFFLTVGDSEGLRISEQVSVIGGVTDTVTTFDELQFYEQDLYNLIKTGSQWYGESFEFTTSRDYSFSVPNIDASSSLELKTNVVARSTVGGNYFSLYVNGSSYGTIPISTVSGVYYDDYVKEATNTQSISNPSTSINIQLDYSKPSNASIAYLNYLELQCRRNLTFSGGQMKFRDSEVISIGGVAEYQLNGYQNGLMILDVSDPLNPINQNYEVNGSNVSFESTTDELKEFIVLTNDYFHPISGEKVDNQNLHSLEQHDMIIISYVDFLTEAERLAQFHREQDDLSVVVVTPEQVFNEFSGGRQDVMAFRNFLRMFYKRAQTDEELPKYLLLFGDGSYDPKNRIDNNTNLVLSYQSPNSYKPTQSYTSDDFYVLLDDDEGVWNNGIELIDMGVGRFPVNTVQQAREMVDKTIRYASTDLSNQTSIEGCGNLLSTQSTFGDWRNNIVFIGDDEDGNIHMSQSDQLATLVDTTYENLNIQKIYFDAYVQESFPGGDRYPDVTDAINRAMEQGALIINYTGHGGELGWAHERVLEISDIQAWDNYYNMPVLMTATCEFSRFDDPELVSAGELVFLNPTGGAVAMFTTVRLVYSSPNFILNQNFYQNLLEEGSSESPRLGDIFMRMKQASGGSSNHRNFTLLGDPAIKLSYPEYEVNTLSINDFDVSIVQDTISSLEKVTISGAVYDGGSVAEDFQGVVYPTVFDKKSVLSTLGNDGGSVFNFEMQKNILYKGKATIEDGRFEFTFIVPKDIAYNYGIGRISYYVLSDIIDGTGFFEDFIIGGSADSSQVDVIGPEINLYINDESFAFGGTTNENPILIAAVMDSSGINTVGNGIGHDIVAILDEESSDPYILNEYYESNIDDYKSGEVKYNFSDLPEGRHQLTLKVWDVHNNSSEAYTEFVVASNAEIALEHVLNYPNPFTTSTEFFFEHNQACEELKVQVQIYTVSGKLVKTINEDVHTVGYRSDGIAWDGLDDYGDPLAKGVYVYKIKVLTPDGASAQKIEKLVILR